MSKLRVRCDFCDCQRIAAHRRQAIGRDDDIVARGPRMLVILSGLPGTGKTTIARALARATGAVHIRIDSIEQPLRDAGWHVEGEGYRVAHAMAADNLSLARTVVADCVNPWPLTRDEWRAVADRAGVPALEVEIVCSDREEHRRRVESRAPDIPNHIVPTWDEVMRHDYRPWDRERMVIDTAVLDIDAAVREIVRGVRLQADRPG